MLQKLAQKYSPYLDQLILHCNSYLTADLGNAVYAYVVSVQTMHHFVEDIKVALYQKIKSALKPSGKYIEGETNPLFTSNLRSNKKEPHEFREVLSVGALCVSRTRDQRFRKPLLYPLS